MSFFQHLGKSKLSYTFTVRIVGVDQSACSRSSFASRTAPWPGTSELQHKHDGHMTSSKKEKRRGSAPNINHGASEQHSQAHRSLIRSGSQRGSFTALNALNEHENINDAKVCDDGQLISVLLRRDKKCYHSKVGVWSHGVDLGDTLTLPVSLYMSLGCNCTTQQLQTIDKKIFQLAVMQAGRISHVSPVDFATHVHLDGSLYEWGGRVGVGPYDVRLHIISRRSSSPTSSLSSSLSSSSTASASASASASSALAHDATVAADTLTITHTNINMKPTHRTLPSHSYPTLSTIQNHVSVTTQEREHVELDDFYTAHDTNNESTLNDTQNEISFENDSEQENTKPPTTNKNSSHHREASFLTCYKQDIASASSPVCRSSTSPPPVVPLSIIVPPTHGTIVMSPSLAAAAMASPPAPTYACTAEHAPPTAMSTTHSGSHQQYTCTSSSSTSSLPFSSPTPTHRPLTSPYSFPTPSSVRGSTPNANCKFITPKTRRGYSRFIGQAEEEGELWKMMSECTSEEAL